MSTVWCARYMRTKGAISFGNTVAPFITAHSIELLRFYFTPPYPQPQRYVDKLALTEGRTVLMFIIKYFHVVTNRVNLRILCQPIGVVIFTCILKSDISWVRTDKNDNRNLNSKKCT